MSSHYHSRTERAPTNSSDDFSAGASDSLLGSDGVDTIELHYEPNTGRSDFDMEKSRGRDLNDERRPPSPKLARDSIHECDRSSTHDGPPSQKDSASTGFWKTLPYEGFAALIGVLGCTVGSLIILAESNGELVDSWGGGLSPSVYLSITSIIANALLGYALAYGLVITFWRKALHGCALEDLHYNWEAAHSLKGAIACGLSNRAKRSALACILAGLSVLRGPLYQKSSYVRSSVPVQINGTMPSQVAEELPDGFTGYNSFTRVRTDRETAGLTGNFSQIMKEYSTGTELKMDQGQCGDECTVTLRAFGFMPNCTTSQVTRLVTDSINDNYDEILFSTGATLYNDTALDDDISVDFTAPIRINTTRFSPEDRSWSTEPSSNNLSDTSIYHTLTATICDLHPGIITYTLRLSNSTATILSPVISGSTDDLATSQRSAYSNFTSTPLVAPSWNGGTSTLGGFQYAFDELFASTATFEFSGAVSTMLLTGSPANQYLNMTAQVIKSLSTVTNLTWSDPTADFLNAATEIAFRTALYAAGLNASLPGVGSNASFVGTKNEALYATDWRYAIAAVVLSVSASFAVVGCYWGWWELGRAVSLSPLEIGAAFEAPMLRECGIVGDGKGLEHLVDGVKGVKVVYQVGPGLLRRVDDEQGSV